MINTVISKEKNISQVNNLNNVKYISVTLNALFDKILNMDIKPDTIKEDDMKFVLFLETLNLFKENMVKENTKKTVDSKVIINFNKDIKTESLTIN